MLRSMYSAVSGLRNHQIMLDVVGNNIANVNTFGFKAGRAVFEDNLSQIVRGASAPVPASAGVAGSGVGGTNPAQIGLGVRLGAITNVFTQGGLQVTNQVTDVAVSGDGFFVVKKAGAQLYTREGAFNFDTDGNLVTSSGNYVQGWMSTDANGTMPVPQDGTNLANITLPDAAMLAAHGGAMESFQINQDGTLTGSFADGKKINFGQLALSTFNNPPGLEKAGGSLYRETTNSGVPVTGIPAQGGRGTLESGTLEMSNVDLAQEFTQLIVAQRGFQANSKVVTTSDEVLNDLIQMKR
jgi:flagellar hook protein FlgE